MRLKCVILDGFKSYAHRQEIGDLDPHFNAITGLNGSGKSNIFDALCFVMGISSLKRVRAEEPRDLIYKSGNAGIQKAQVTIEFTNDDEVTAPPGYPPSEFPTIRIGRQVQVGGKQKFFLNDRVSDQTKIKNFFRNALLNVDNAHFMVLQGTVHKMISMKSVEILGLLEEASGTRIFDTRRRTAENLLRSKEKRVEAIHAAIDELTPRIAAMKNQQEEYNQFVRARDTFAEKSRFPLAFDYFMLSKNIDEKSRQIAASAALIDGARRQLQDIPSARAEAERAIGVLRIKGEEPLERLEQLRGEEGECRKEIAKFESMVQARTKHLQSLERDLKKSESELEAIRASLGKFESETKPASERHQSLAYERLQVGEKIKALKQSLHLQKTGVKAGLNGMSLQEEKETLKRRAIQMDGQARRDGESLRKLQQDIARLRTACASEEDMMSAAEAKLARCQSAFAAAEKGYLPLQAVQERASLLKHRAAEQREKIQRLTTESYETSDIQPLRFDTVSGHDFSKDIIGRAGGLLLVKDPRYSKALTAGAGLSLLRVVVSSKNVAQMMIEKKALRERTTFLPLDSVTANTIDPKRLSVAKEIAHEMGGFVELASSLVEFDTNYSVIADLVFGGFVVCSELQLAQRLSSDPRTRIKAVSMDGDVSESNGIVTGGSNRSMKDFVAEFRRLKKSQAPLDAARKELHAVESELFQCQSQLEAARPTIAKFQETEAAFLAAEHTVKGLREGAAAAHLGEVEAEVAALQQKLVDAKREAASVEERLREVEMRLSDDPDTALREIERQLKFEIQHEQQLDQQAKDGAAAVEKIQEQLLSLQQRSLDGDAEVKRLSEEARENRDELEQLRASLELSRQKSADVARRLQEQEAKSLRLHRELEEAEAEIQRLQEQEASLNTAIKDGEAQSRIMTKELQSDKHKLTQTKKDHPWIQEAEAAFGDPSGPFYFDDERRTKTTLDEIAKLRSIISQSERSVNEKASMLYDAYKKDLDQLDAQRATLSTDRSIILSTIEAVETRKWGALDKMFKEVTHLFGSLFSACLPNASARLVEERDPSTQRLTGLQVRVAFNGKEKESLTELSGGQRSLLALCLILAILRVRPAPVYILDEVDAALDPSHTQNIGHMLQTHFPTSQFLLVSLKDGMYNNANVLYEIRNTQGYSEVTRRGK